MLIYLYCIVSFLSDKIKQVAVQSITSSYKTHVFILDEKKDNTIVKTY